MKKTIQVTVSAEDHKAYCEVMRSIGFYTPSIGLRIFIKQVINTEKFPFMPGKDLVEDYVYLMNECSRLRAVIADLEASIKQQ